jgi:hypothetical protein
MLSATATPINAHTRVQHPRRALENASRARSPMLKPTHGGPRDADAHDVAAPPEVGHSDYRARCTRQTNRLGQFSGARGNGCPGVTRSVE